MVGTYKYAGKEVSEREFKKKVYGVDSAQVKNYDKAQAKKSSSSKSNYSSGKDREGNPIYWDESGQRKEGRSPDYVEPEKKAPIVIGVGKDETGRTKVENVGKYLTEEQRREVSRLTSEKGRLTTEELKRSESMNAQGQTVVSSSVRFSYKEAEKKDSVPVDQVAKNVIEQKQSVDASAQEKQLYPYAPESQGVPFQTTRTDMNDPVELGGVFVTEEKEKEPSVMSAFVDDRSEYAKNKANIKEKLFTQGDTDPLTAKEVLYSAPVFVEGVVRTGGQVVKGFVVGGVVQTVKAFTVDIDQTLQGVTDLVTGKTKLSQVGDALTASLYENPAYFAGQTVFALAGAKVIGGGSNLAKNAYVRVGSKFVEPEIVFAETVLSGAENLPTTSSVSKSLAKFKQADDVVQTSSPAKISGTQAGLGRKGAVGLEDTGIYVTPAGEGSPYFLRLGADGDYSLVGSNPLSNVKNTFDVPTVTRARTTGVETYPREVVSQAGFKAVQEFQEAQAGSGKAFISKRSEIGQGELPRQSFIAPDDFVEGSFNIKKGDVLREAGTSEIEAVIPSGQKFAYVPESTIGKIKGFDQYTTFNGRNVAIRDTVLLTDEASNVVVDVVGDRAVVFGGSKIQSEASYLSSSGGSKSLTSPYALVSGSKSLTSPYALVSGSSQIVSSPSVVAGGSSQIVSQPSYIVKSKIFSSSQIISEPSVVSRPSRGSRGSRVSPVASFIVSEPSVVSKPSSVVSGGSSGFSGGSVSSGSSGGSSSGLYSSFGGSSLIPSPYKSSISRQKKVSGFDVFVRTRGSFKKISKTALGQSDARDLGAYNVANTPQATFTLRPSSSPVGFGSSKARGSFSAFRSNFLRKGGLFIEKKEKRIKSGGEKAGITRLGILANKRKGMFKGLKL